LTGHLQALQGSILKLLDSILERTQNKSKEIQIRFFFLKINSIKSKMKDTIKQAKIAIIIIESLLFYSFVREI